MKRFNFKVLSIIGLAFFASVSVLNMRIGLKNDTTMNIFLVSTEALASGEDSASSDCGDCSSAGGKGSTSCSCSGSLEILGVKSETSCSVSTGDGYYSCCHYDNWNGCTCPSCPN